MGRCFAYAAGVSRHWAWRGRGRGGSDFPALPLPGMARDARHLAGQADLFFVGLNKSRLLDFFYQPAAKIFATKNKYKQ